MSTSDTPSDNEHEAIRKADENALYGPLTHLIGTWQGDKGTDIAPEPDGVETNNYYETIVFTPIGDTTNAESQVLGGVRYHQKVQRKNTGKVIHDQTGYWLWDAENQMIIHSFTIPRGVCVLAGGTATDTSSGIELNVNASANAKDWAIIESPFMQEKARTESFKQSVAVQENELHYTQTTYLDIYGRKFEHTDENTLTKLAK